MPQQVYFPLDFLSTASVYSYSQQNYLLEWYNSCSQDLKIEQYKFLLAQYVSNCAWLIGGFIHEQNDVGDFVNSYPFDQMKINKCMSFSSHSLSICLNENLTLGPWQLFSVTPLALIFRLQIQSVYDKGTDFRRLEQLL